MAHRPLVEQGIWRIRTNQKLRKELSEDVDIADIKEKTLEWIGHLVRVDQGRTVKKIFDINWKEVEEGEDLD
jgi:hypothetical protein